MILAMTFDFCDSTCLPAKSRQRQDKQKHQSTTLQMQPNSFLQLYHHAKTIQSFSTHIVNKAFPPNPFPIYSSFVTASKQHITETPPPTASIEITKSVSPEVKK